MQRAPIVVELYLGLWAALAIPMAFAGLVFLVPGFYPVEGLVLLGLAAVLVAYLWFLVKPVRQAWLAGLALHLAGLLWSAAEVRGRPLGLAAPALGLNALSLVVLLAYRRLWTAAQPVPRAVAEGAR